MEASPAPTGPGSTPAPSSSSSSSSSSRDRRHWLSAMAVLPKEVVEKLAPGRRAAYLARLVASCAPEQLLLLPLELFQLMGAAQQAEVVGRIKVRRAKGVGEGGGPGTADAWRRRISWSLRRPCRAPACSGAGALAVQIRV
jgi:hypothetical protein